MSKVNVCGIICEYNPFHNGHMHQITEARKLSKAKYVIAVMSGNFVQRGEPAVVDKWARTEMALRCGADLVLELPTVYAISSAQYFASGAIDILKKTGVVTHISFGSESFEGKDGARRLLEIAKATINGPEIDQESLKKGASFAAASRNSVLSQPNDILATEYLRAMQHLDAKMEIVPIKRVGEGHIGVGSAIYIRKLLAEGDIEKIQNSMPEQAFKILKREILAGKGPIFSSAMDEIVLADLRRLGVEGLRDRPFVSEGLEFKIFSEACECNTFNELISECTSKRYTSSRIRRIVFASVLGILRKMVYLSVPYIRILGLRGESGELIDLLREKAAVPVITSRAKFLRDMKRDSRISDCIFCANAAGYCAKTAIEFLEIESNAADLYSLTFKYANSRAGASDTTHPIVVI